MAMTIYLIGSLILAALTLLLRYFLHSNNDEDLSIPYATYGSYPIVGHLFSFVRDRKKLVIECRQRYGECFRIRALNQRFIMILSHTDWMTIVRNQSFEFMGKDFGMKIFDLSPVFHSKDQFLKRI